MVINTNTSLAAGLLASQTTASKTNTQPATTATENAATTQNFSASAEDLAAFSSEITSGDVAQQSTATATNSILNQSSLAILAHGQLSSQSVLDLLAD